MNRRKQDRRVIRTRKALGEALISLMLKDDYESITVRDVTNRANIGYATFYRHFKSKDELLIFALNAAVDDGAKSLSLEMTSHEQAMVLFRNIRKHRGAYQASLTLPRNHPVLKAVHKNAALILADLYVARSGSDVPFDVSVNHMILSARELVRWYLANEEHYSIEKAAAILCKLVTDACQKLALEKRQPGAVGSNASHLQRIRESSAELPETPA